MGMMADRDHFPSQDFQTNQGPNIQTVLFCDRWAMGLGHEETCSEFWWTQTKEYYKWMLS